MADEEKDGAIDGQPTKNWYVPSVMGIVDVIGNILDKFQKAGVTHSFQGNDLYITAVELAHDQKQAQEDLTQVLKEVVSYLKKEFKDTTGKALSLGEEEWKQLDVTAYYSTSKQALCRLTVCYDLPDFKAEVDASAEQGELPGSIPVLKPKNK